MNKKAKIYAELPTFFLKEIFNEYDSFFYYHYKYTKPKNIIFNKDYKGDILPRFSYMNKTYDFIRRRISKKMSNIYEKNYDIKILFNNEVVLSTNYYILDKTSTVARERNLPKDEIPFDAPIYESTIDENYQIFNSSIWISHLCDIREIFRQAEFDVDASIIEDLNKEIFIDTEDD